MATRRGTDGNDVLTGTDERDYLYGLGGADVLEGGDDRDRLYGGPGADTLRGGKGIDYLYGGEGKDILEGGDDHTGSMAGRVRTPCGAEKVAIKPTTIAVWQG